MTHWLGVRPLDKIPRKFPPKKFLIVNLSPSFHPGSHWIVLCRPHKDRMELFNSLGSQTIDDLKPHLNFTFKSKISFNNSPLQLDSSSSCGLYCIYFVIHRFLNLDQDFDEVLEDSFAPSLHENENKVSNFCQHLLNLSHPSKLFDSTF